MSENFKILSFKEEIKLTHCEKIKYFSQLQEYLKNTPHEGLSKGSLSICETINPFVRSILTAFCGYENNVTYFSDVSGLNAIYAHSHQSKMDHVNFITSNPNHTILMNSCVLSELYKMILRINGVCFVDKSSRDSKAMAKKEMIRLLLNDKSITMFPESAWNLSPNKLHLPLYYGVVDIARKSGMPIIPVVQEYTYDERKLDGIERVKSVNIKYCEPIFVGFNDDIDQKLQLLSDVISTARWEMIEQKGVFTREEIDNSIYINFLKGCIRNLENAGIDINVEKQHLLGANDDFYLFNHINAVDFDDDGNLLPTEYMRKLSKIIK